MRDIYESAGEIIWQNNGQEWSGFLFNSRRSRISNTKCPRVCVYVCFFLSSLLLFCGLLSAINFMMMMMTMMMIMINFYVERSPDLLAGREWNILSQEPNPSRLFEPRSLAVQALGFGPLGLTSSMTTQCCRRIGAYAG